MSKITLASGEITAADQIVIDWFKAKPRPQS